MIELLRQYLIQRLGNDIVDLEDVLTCFRQIKVKRNEIILRQGDICRQAYFVVKIRPILPFPEG